MNWNTSHSFSRREMLNRVSSGFGMMALSGLAASNSLGALSTAKRKRHPDFRPKAKQVILCYMSGGVSHVDTFDPKPRLRDMHGKPMPGKSRKDPVSTTTATYLAAHLIFHPEAKAVSRSLTCFPIFEKAAPTISASVRSMTSAVNEHAQGNFAFHTGFPFIGHPSAGAWCSYGLGTENSNLPGYVVLRRRSRPAFPTGALGSGAAASFPPSIKLRSFRSMQRNPFETFCRASATNSKGRDWILSTPSIENSPDASERMTAVEAAIQNYETAYRMQSAVPELCDISGERRRRRSDSTVSRQKTP